jgi:hypothetical protein
MPLSDGIASNRRISASMPPAEAPMPTTGNAVVAALPNVSVMLGSLWPRVLSAESCDKGAASFRLAERFPFLICLPFLSHGSPNAGRASHWPLPSTNYGQSVERFQSSDGE